MLIKNGSPEYAAHLWSKQAIWSHLHRYFRLQTKELVLAKNILHARVNEERSLLNKFQILLHYRCQQIPLIDQISYFTPRPLYSELPFNITYTIICLT